MIHPEEIHRFLSSLVSKPPKITIIIDKETDEVREASKALKKLGETEVVEFKAYVRQDAENEEKAGKRKLPEHYEGWKKILTWVDESTESLVELLSAGLRNNLVDVYEAPLGRHYYFYRGKLSSKSIFAVFLLTKKYLNVRIRTDLEL